MTASSRGRALLLLGLVSAGCGSTGPRPVPEIVRPDTDTIDRLRVDETARELAAVKLIAMPTDEDVSVDGAEPPGTLTFEQLLRSVEQQFPLVLAALEELEIAEGELLSAQGNFDLRLAGAGNFAAEGFYENDQGRLFLQQPTPYGGATFFGGYKIGRGDFADWDGGLQTNDGGEFSAGVRLPLLAGREIDARRAELWKARLGQAQARPLVLKSRLDATVKAADAYWKWAAAGQKLLIAERLLALAEDRQEAISDGVAVGEFAQIADTDNRRLVVERQSIVIRQRRELEQAAIGLSIFLRGADGEPRVPLREELPSELPTPTNPALITREGDAEMALRMRPEVRVLELELERIQLDIDKAENDTLPRFDIGVAGSQDIGGAASDPDDKGPFELDAFFLLDVPLQRRDARGRVRSLAGRSVQLERGLQLTRDRVVADVRDADSALQRTWERLALGRENVQLAGTLEEAERVDFREGESDLFQVNIREQQTAAAAAELVDIIAEHFRSLAQYRASLGVPYDEVQRVPVPEIEQD